MDKYAGKLLANNLRRARYRHNWSQQFVCNQIQISIRTLSRAENGKGLSSKTLKRLALLYKVPVAKLYEPETVSSDHRQVLSPLSFESVVHLLCNSDFVCQIQRETLLAFNDTIQRQALLSREEAEDILSGILNERKSYSRSDLIMAVIISSQVTTRKISEMIVS